MKKYDVIVIGGGHAGCEAAHAAARSGSKTLLITMKKDAIGQMSCNPAVGGIGKSHLAREVDALDGLMCMVSDNAALQRRKLNSRKGPAVQATRIQTCRDTYKFVIQQYMFSQPCLEISEGTVSDLIIKDNKVWALSMEGPEDVLGARVFVLTAGTFLGGKIHLGDKSYSAGRAGDKASVSLDEFFRAEGFPVDRLKTGTPPRLLKSSIDFKELIPQNCDEDNPCLSYYYDHYMQKPNNIQRIPCHITYTNQYTHSIISNSKELSPMYDGRITSIGPRYCPSIEDKIERFSDKSHHQIFLEPETLSDNEIYPNGISTSLPEKVQLEFLRTIKGLESVEMTKPGYAIEYSYFNPTNLYNTLATKQFENLFFAGQINGTTGYEEAAAQGIIAGINASLYCKDKDLWCPTRENSYIGVMIDDLVTQGVTEPYRMFTSRAEHRLRLREDNADERLTETGYNLGVVGQRRYDLFKIKMDKLDKESRRLEQIIIRPNTRSSLYLSENFDLNLKSSQPIKSLLKMSTIEYQDLYNLEEFGVAQYPEVGELIAIRERYAGYLKRQDIEIESLHKSMRLSIPRDIDYMLINGLSNEAKEKLLQIRPTSLEQASRIPGMTSSMITILKIYLKSITQ